MQTQAPATAEELAECLHRAASEGQKIRLGGNFTKDAMAGALEPSDVTVSTRSLNRVLQYEPRDLTISVEAGMLFSGLTQLLAANAQMVPLDPPFFDSATVGGVIAANTTGPRRRLYGSVRDVVIGMTFATLEGKLVKTGGMVVKNVAGLDMGKLMIGSFGTLAAVTTVNFKLFPVPPVEGTFVLSFSDLASAVAKRDQILRSVLQPAAIDLLNPEAAAITGLRGWTLLLQVGGSKAVLERYAVELGGGNMLSDADARETWTQIREFTPRYLGGRPEGAVVRISCTLAEVGPVLRDFAGPAVARAGTGVVYLYYADARQASVGKHRGAIEFAPETEKRRLDLWPSPGSSFGVMENVKRMFDPGNLLNRGRLYGRI